MKFKNSAVEPPRAGIDYTKEVELTVPDDAMSLQEIIERFVRGEELAIGKDVSFHESEDDLEELNRMDMVDKAAYIKRMKEVQNQFEAQEAERLEKFEALEREKFLAEKRKEWETEAQKELVEPSKTVHPAKSGRNAK